MGKSSKLVLSRTYGTINKYLIATALLIYMYLIATVILILMKS